jgi:hypothetical protein
MSSSHRTNGGSASATALQGVCHVSLKLFSNFIDLLGTPIAALFDVFGINTPWDDDHHPWIKPEKHCQDFRIGFPKDANSVDKATICLLAFLLCLLVSFTLGVADRNRRARNAQRGYELRIRELFAAEIRAVDLRTERTKAVSKRLKKRIAEVKKQTARTLRAIEEFEAAGYRTGDLKEGSGAEGREGALF